MYVLNLWTIPVLFLNIKCNFHVLQILSLIEAVGVGSKPVCLIMLVLSKVVV